MNLILIEAHEMAPDRVVVLAGPRAAQVRDVLKVQPGDRVRVGMVDGPIGEATVVTLSGTSVEILCDFGHAVSERPRVDLLLALPRPKVLKRLWAQLAALGVGRIVLTNAARVERHYFDTHVLSESSYRPLLIEGLQQARDTRLPIVSIERQFRRFVEDELDRVFDAGLRVVAHPERGGRLQDAVEREAPERLVLAIGPEGGWNTFELNMLETHGFRLVTMGSRTLRTDTAAVGLLTLAHDALERLPEVPGDRH